MSQFNEAADAIRNVAAKLRGFEVAAAALESVGSLDQAAKEAQKARDQSVKAAEKAKADLTKLQAEITDTEQTKAKLLADATAAAEAMILDADNKAKMALEAVKVQCQEAKDAYNVSLKASIDEAKAEVAKAKESAAKAKKKADELDAEIAEKQAQLDSLNAMLADIKAKLGV